MATSDFGAYQLTREQSAAIFLILHKLETEEFITLDLFLGAHDKAYGCQGDLSRAAELLEGNVEDRDFAVSLYTLAGSHQGLLRTGLMSWVMNYEQDEQSAIVGAYILGPNLLPFGAATELRARATIARC